MHEYYWENYTEMDEYGYENYDNQQALLHQVHANEEKLSKRKRLTKMLESPFFGRVDFRYDGEEESETFYIGIGNFAPRAGMRPLIVIIFIAILIHFRIIFPVIFMHIFDFLLSGR